MQGSPKFVKVNPDVDLIIESYPTVPDESYTLTNSAYEFESSDDENTIFWSPDDTNFVPDLYSGRTDGGVVDPVDDALFDIVVCVRPWDLSTDRNASDN